MPVCYQEPQRSMMPCRCPPGGRRHHETQWNYIKTSLTNPIAAARSRHITLSLEIGLTRRIIASESSQFRVPDIDRQATFNRLNISFVQRLPLILKKPRQKIRIQYPDITTFRLGLHKPARIKDNRSSGRKPSSEILRQPIPR